MGGTPGQVVSPPPNHSHLRKLFLSCATEKSLTSHGWKPVGIRTITLMACNKENCSDTNRSGNYFIEMSSSENSPPPPENIHKCFIKSSILSHSSKIPINSRWSPLSRGNQTPVTVKFYREASEPKEEPIRNPTNRDWSESSRSISGQSGPDRFHARPAAEGNYGTRFRRSVCCDRTAGLRHVLNCRTFLWRNTWRDFSLNTESVESWH